MAAISEKATFNPTVAPISQPAQTRKTYSPVGIIDCDVHVNPKSDDEIRHYISDRWKSRYRGGGRDLFAHPMFVNREDARPPSGLPIGADPEFVWEQHVVEYGINHVILLHRAFCNPLPNTEYATAVASAFNDWLADTWLGKYNKDGVYHGSIHVAHQDPQASAKEIERWAGDRRFVQVLSDSGARSPFGQKYYDPIYEACEKYNLPFATHVGTDGIGINIQASIGYPTHYIEWSTCHALGYQNHLISMLVEGVFERFPKLKVVLVEGGVTWLPTLLWRLDNQYERCKSEVPFLKRKPSEYIRDHVRVSSQPLERPENDRHLLKMLDLMEAEHVLMFASDYPHWDFDSPRLAFPKLPEKLRQRIFWENANELYQLEPAS
jgi:uncharacterized protein